MENLRFAALLVLAAVFAPLTSAGDEKRSNAAGTAPALLEAAALRADAAILRRAYETLHPGLYRYNTPALMASEFRALEQEFTRDRTLAEAYLAFSVFAAKIKCGHTYANFYNQKKAVQQELFEAGRVPFYFRWLGDQMIVTRSFANHPRLVPGAEVLAINGTPVAQILERLLTVARADGNNEAKRRSYLEVQGNDRYEAFDVFFPLFFPSSAAELTLRIRGPEGESEIRVAPQSAAARRELFAATGAAPEKNGPVWELSLLENHLAHLRMPTWALYDSSWDWKAFLAATFERLEQNGIQDLVVDLRGNEGGVDVGEVIVSHLIQKPAPRQVVERRVRYRKVPEDLLPYLDTWDPSFKDWGNAAVEEKDGFFRLRRDADDDPGSPIAPAKPTFEGRLWVLVGAVNSSATFEFAQMVRQNRLGKLVGQNTGGNQRGINGGAFFFLRLPNSGIELDLPLIGQFPAEAKPDAGLEPDILVTASPEDLAAGRDVEMAAVRAAVASGRPPGQKSDAGAALFRRQRSDVSAAELHPIKQIFIFGDTGRVDEEETLHGSAAMPHRLDLRLFKSGAELLGSDPGQQRILLPGDADAHVALDQEDETAEHLLFFDPGCLVEKLPHPLRQSFVVSHAENPQESSSASETIMPPGPRR